jgi:hypothetical protein
LSFWTLLLAGLNVFSLDTLHYVVFLSINSPECSVQREQFTGNVSRILTLTWIEVVGRRSDFLTGNVLILTGYAAALKPITRMDNNLLRSN